MENIWEYHTAVVSYTLSYSLLRTLGFNDSYDLRLTPDSRPLAMEGGTCRGGCGWRHVSASLCHLKPCWGHANLFPRTTENSQNPVWSTWYSTTPGDRWDMFNLFWGLLLDGMWTRLLRRVVLWVASTETNMATIGKIFLLGSRWNVDKTTCWGAWADLAPKIEFLNTRLSSKSIKTADRTWTNADKRKYLKGRVDNPAPKTHLLLEGCHWNQSRNKEQENLSRFVEVMGAVGEQGQRVLGQIQPRKWAILKGH